MRLPTTQFLIRTSVERELHPHVGRHDGSLLIVADVDHGGVQPTADVINGHRVGVVSDQFVDDGATIPLARQGAHGGTVQDILPEPLADVGAIRGRNLHTAVASLQDTDVAPDILLGFVKAELGPGSQVLDSSLPVGLSTALDATFESMAEANEHGFAASDLLVVSHISFVLCRQKEKQDIR